MFEIKINSNVIFVLICIYDLCFLGCNESARKERYSEEGTGIYKENLSGKASWSTSQFFLAMIISYINQEFNVYMFYKLY